MQTARRVTPDMEHLINLKLLDLSLNGIRTLPASTGLLKSTKFVIVGLSSSVRKQLNSHLVDVYIKILVHIFQLI